jgi:uncharacterized protein (DUF3084 family)
MENWRQAREVGFGTLITADYRQWLSELAVISVRENCMHGKPWFRLLRHEVEALVKEKSGQDHLQNKKLQKELADINQEARKLKTRLAAIERRRSELMKERGG